MQALHCRISKPRRGHQLQRSPAQRVVEPTEEGHALVLAQGGVGIHECFDESEHERVTQTIRGKLAHWVLAAEVLEHSREPGVHLSALNPLAGHLSIWRHRHSVATCRG